MYRGKFLSSSPVSRNGENIEGAETTTRVREARSVPPIVNPRRNRVQTGSKRQTICNWVRDADLRLIKSNSSSKPSALAPFCASATLIRESGRILVMSSRNTDNGPLVGDLVVLTATPPGLLDGLPPEDREAIAGMVGTRVRLNDYDNAGRAELVFADRQGIVHYIYVNPSLMRAAG